MSQNPPDSSTDNNSKNIPKVVGDHADRLMDSLFADIEELLSSDGRPIQKSPTTAIRKEQTTASHQSERELTGQGLVHEHQYQPTGIGQHTGLQPTPPKTGTWKKILIGLSLAAIAAGGTLWWLAKERKINLDAVMPSDVSKADIQFADYLGRSVSKIDSGTNELTPPVNPVANQVTSPNPPSAPATIAPQSAVPTTPAVPVTGSSFTKVIKSNPPTAEFLINGKIQQLTTGDKIGKSGWAVISAAGNEVIIKRNDELRTLKAGQQF
jgi:hypothetical protein